MLGPRGHTGRATAPQHQAPAASGASARGNARPVPETITAPALVARAATPWRTSSSSSGGGGGGSSSVLRHSSSSTSTGGDVLSSSSSKSRSAHSWLRSYNSSRCAITRVTCSEHSSQNTAGTSSQDASSSTLSQATTHENESAAASLEQEDAWRGIQGTTTSVMSLKCHANSTCKAPCATVDCMLNAVEPYMHCRRCSHHSLAVVTFQHTSFNVACG